MESSGEVVIKYWLMNIAMEFPRSLSLLFPSVKGEALNVREIPDCEPQEYAGTLIELFEAGLIKLESDFPGDDVSNKLGVSKIIERFVLLPKDERQIRYSPPSAQPLPGEQHCEDVRFQLTAAGGQEWETLAEPDWSLFFKQSGDETTGDVELASPNFNLLMARMGWFRGLNGDRIKAEAIRIETHSNYPVLYWKSLPLVHEAFFFVDLGEPRWAKDWALYPEWFQKWWISTDSWYKKPWELSIWPSK